MIEGSKKKPKTWKQGILEVLLTFIGHSNEILPFIQYEAITSRRAKGYMQEVRKGWIIGNKVVGPFSISFSLVAAFANAV